MCEREDVLPETFSLDAPAIDLYEEKDDLAVKADMVARMQLASPTVAKHKEHAMYTDEYEELIQIEAGQLSETLFSAAYFDLAPELQLWIRARAIDTLWPADARESLVAAA